MKIKPVEHIVYQVGNQEFFTQEEAEQQLQRMERFLNSTYYDVIHTAGLRFPIGNEPLQRRIIAVSGFPDGDEFYNIAWVSDALRTVMHQNINYHESETDKAPEWKVVGQHTFSSFQELSHYIKDWLAQSTDYDYKNEILRTGLEPESMSFQEIHDIAKSE